MKFKMTYVGFAILRRYFDLEILQGVMKWN